MTPEEYAHRIIKIVRRDGEAGKEADLCDLVLEAVAEERERCAKTVEATHSGMGGIGDTCCEWETAHFWFAKKIRAAGNPTNAKKENQ